MPQQAEAVPLHAEVMPLQVEIMQENLVLFEFFLTFALCSTNHVFALRQYKEPKN